ncbi:hypothetical protein MHBO_001246 [Bonamia ostreae]|uniref:Uncharacterized protein n=1 Tax=Bonamia ostreae TaxID=126728 RepID=A0ABV2AIC7_9EUKA
MFVLNKSKFRTPHNLKLGSIDIEKRFIFNNLTPLDKSKRSNPFVDKLSKQPKNSAQIINEHIPKSIRTKYHIAKDIPSPLVKRLLYKMHKKAPIHWTKQRLASAFGFRKDQIEFFLKCVQIEENIKETFHSDLERMSKIDRSNRSQFTRERQKCRFYGKKKEDLSNHLNDSLYVQIVPFLSQKNIIYSPHKQYLEEVFNRRTGMFGYNKRDKCFGSTPDGLLDYDLGPERPSLKELKVPRKGVGSGKVIEEVKKVRPLKAPMIITEISKIGSYKSNKKRLPTRVRGKDGVMRHTTFLEYKTIRKRETGGKTFKKFVPI